MRALRSRLRATLRDEDGFTIIEVLVSALLIGMAVVGVFSALDSATATSGSNKARNVAASLAQSDQERLRGMSPTALSNRRETATKTVNGATFTVSSRGDWISDQSGTASCGSTDTRADYLKITSTVSSQSLRALRPVTSQSLKAVPNGSFGPNAGSVAIQVSDRNGAGVPNVPITIAGPQTFAETTNAAGCVLIGYAPVGTYSVSFSQPGWVRAPFPNDPAVADSVVVAGEGTSRKEYVYDQAGNVAVSFVTKASSTAPSLPTPGERFTVGHSGLVNPTLKTFSGTAASTLNAAGLFPFPTPYGVWAGGCEPAKPTLNGQSANPAVTVAPGGTATATVFEPTINVTVKKSDGTAQSGAKVVISPTVSGCAVTQTLTTPSNGTVSTSLPYGTYSICAQDKTTSPTKRRLTTPLNNKTPNSSPYTLTLPSGTSNPASC